MKLILPLAMDFALKTKKDRHVKYSLNEFMLDLSDTGRTKNGKLPNHYYQKKAKQSLQTIVQEQLKDMEPLEAPWPKKVVLTIYRGSNRRMDIIDNPVVLIKFAMDIIKIKHAPEDDWRYFNESTIRDGGLDKENPRAELEIITNEGSDGQYTN